MKREHSGISGCGPGPWLLFFLVLLSMSVMAGPGVARTSPTQRLLTDRVAGVMNVEIINVQPVSCHGLADGSAEAVVTGGTPPFTYVWDSSPSQSTAVLSGMGAGTYTVLVTDAAGNTASASVLIVGPAEPLGASITSFTNVLCNTTGTGTATVTAAGGTPPYTYSWNTSSPQTGVTATGLAEGTYTVTVTDANGCTATATVTITDSSAPILAVVEDYSHVSCFGANDGYITLNLSGASNQFTVVWNTVPPVTGPTINGLAPGLYDATITDNNGCDTPKYMSFGILGPSAPLAIDLAVSPTTCSNTLNGAVDLTITGGNAPYSHIWTDPISGQSTTLEDLSGLDPGTYLLQVIDAFGCPIDTSVTITSPAPIVINLDITQISCATGATGSITASVQGGTGAYTLAWTGPDGFSSNAATIDDLPPGAFTLSVTDANNCTATASATIALALPPTLNITTSITPSGDAISCAGGSDGTVDLTITDGLAPFTITWTDGLGFTSSDEDLAGLTAGTYFVTVTDANNCQANASVTLTAPPSIDLSATLSTAGAFNTSCPEATDGSIDLSITGGSPGYTTLWSTGSTDEDLTAVSAGTYNVTVTDANGCSTTSSYTLTAPPTIEIDLNVLTFPGGSNVSCPDATDGQITATATGGTGLITLQWTGPTGPHPPGGALTDLSAGTYALTATDANSCQVDTAITLLAPTPLDVTLSSPVSTGGTNIACAGGTTGSITTSVTGGQPGYTYTWTGPGGTVLNGADLQDLGAGLYELTLTDALGCSTTASIVLTEPDTLAVSFTVSDIGGFGTSCTANDGSISTSITGGSPGYVVQWTGPNGFTSNLTNLTDLVAGTYIASVTDANDCTVQGVVTLDAAPPVFVELDPAPGACAGDGLSSISSMVTGGIAPFQYAWTGPDGFTSNAPELIDVEDGTYVLTVTDTLGCTATTSTTLAGPAPLASTLVPSFYGLYNIRCAGDSSGTLSVDVTGGTASYTLTITGPTGTLSGNGPFTQLIAGTYTIGITDANGCSADTSITLTAPDNPITSALTADNQPGGTNISCQGGSDGSIDASITGGSAPYTFAWSGPGGFSAGTEDITGLSAGNAPYVLQVTDSNQCVHSAAITLTEPSSPLIGIGSTSNYGSYAISCSGASDGSIDLFVSGGSPGYTIVWNGPGVEGVQTEDLTGIEAGTYTATITDINGCTATVSFNLDQPEPLVVGTNTFTYPGGSPISCAGANDAQVTANWTGGSAPYSTTWTGPDGTTFNTPSITELGPGTYCVQLVDGQGCTADTCITITEPSPLAITSTSTPADCGTATGTIDLSTSGGSAPYAYAWSNGSTTPDLSGLSAGSYDVTVMDANGCSAQLTTTVTGTAAVQVEGSTTAALCSDALSGSVDITTTSGTAPFQYSWSNGATSEDLAAVGTGSYAVTVLDANGCEATATFTVSAPASIVVDTTLSLYLGGYNVSSWQGQDGSINTDVSGGTGPYTYAWSNGASAPDLDGLAAGEYTLVVTDANGCSTTITVTLTQPSDLVMPTGFTPNGDGSNDVFFIRGLDAYPTNQLVIVNRWGNRVFERVNYRNDWDGESIQGGQLPNGTYFAILQVSGGERTLQGYIDLRR